MAKKIKNEKVNLAYALYTSAGYHVMVQGTIYYLVDSEGYTISTKPLSTLQSLDDVIHHIQELSYADGFNRGKIELRRSFNQLMNP